jgi:cephalosporin-C deacetylase-like acetyl esterase
MTPSDFWQRTEAQLAETPPEISVSRDEFYSQAEWDVYRLNYSTTGRHRLFAWLSVPKERPSGPAPAMLRMPDYASVHDIIYTSIRHGAVVMNATHRGQRNSDGAYRATYPGLLTDGIADGESWALLGAYADCLRAVDVLLAQEIAEIGQVALWGAGLGGSLAIAAASRRPRVGLVAADTPMPLGHPSALEPGLGYPLGEISDYLRAHPDRREDMEQTLGMLDPLGDAGRVSVPVLLSAGRFDRGTCPLPFAEVLAQTLPNCDLRLFDGAAEGGGHIHAQARAGWLADRLEIAQ